MKIQEFRDKMKSAERDKLEIVAAELYKQIPKKRKDEDIDKQIEDILTGITVKAEKKNKTSIPFDELNMQITAFLYNADQGYYWEPNRVVPKSKRSKWRFEVKGFIKELEKITLEDPNYDKSAKLYRELYKRLCYGCGYYIFPTEDPFRSIGIRQGEFYPRLVSRYFGNGFSEEKIRDMLYDATGVYLDRETLYIELQIAFVNALKTHDMRESAIKIAKAEVDKLRAKLLSLPKYSNDKYRIQRQIAELCETILGLSIRLGDNESTAVKYYAANDNERNKEITLYKILDTMLVYGAMPKLWIDTYETAVKKGIEPRESLVMKYNELKNL